MTMRMNRLAVVPLLILLAACEGVEPARAPRLDAVQGEAAEPGGTAVVDSSFPPAEQLRRFRADIDRPTTLVGGAESRDALVRDFMEAVERNDTVALRDLVLNRAEFAWLYYDDSPLSTPPTRMDPALAWFLIEQNSAKGLVRVIRRFGGQRVGYRGYDCPRPPVAMGANHVWERCTIRRVEGDVEQSAAWFGGIIERDGVFKFVSYANGF